MEEDRSAGFAWRFRMNSVRRDWAAWALEDVASRGIVGVDDGELAMRRHAVKHGAQDLTAPSGLQGEYTLDYEFAGGLERAYRRAGAEDAAVILLSSNVEGAPTRKRMALDVGRPGFRLCRRSRVLRALGKDRAGIWFGKSA